MALTDVRGGERSEPRPADRRRAAFSIVELLTAVAVVGVLVAILVPAIQFLRERARLLQCSASLREIGLVTHLYRDSRNGWFPNASKTGNFSYRMAPGMRTVNDPRAYPEEYGLEALYVSLGLLSPASRIWVCPSHDDAKRAYRNTYAFSIATALDKKNPANQSTTLFVWDNYSFNPGLTGFRGPFPGYTIPSGQRTQPHRGFGTGATGYNALYLDGHTEYFNTGN
ncbi:MAG: hypothetical protein K8S94_03105 [Planctomycetia bacterium]|nr:hypothetical protein [Planctomycetia bacterium]